MKKIKVSEEACIGCGACVAIDPEHFAFNDEGLSHPINQENQESEDLRNAIDSCPTSAISMIDAENDCGDDECDCNDECCCDDCHCTENCECHCEEK